MLRSIANAEEEDLPKVQKQVIEYLERNRYPRFVRTEGPYVPRGLKALRKN